MDLETKRVLVTGGAGFIGSRLSQDLLNAGADVHIVDNFFAGKPDLVPEQASFNEVDIRSDGLRDIVQEYNPDAIVHLAAIHYIPYCNENPEETFEVNVIGTRNLLSSAKEVNLERFVFASTAAVYPPRKGPNQEDSELGPTDIYGRTKLIGEDLTKLFHQETGIETAVARVFNTYGPNETNDHLIPAILEQVQNGDRQIELGNLTPARDFIHVRDVSRGLMRLVRDFDGGFSQFNLGTGSECSVREVVDCMSKALGEEVEMLQDNDRVRESDRPHLEADISKMEDRFGWKAEIELLEGLEELIKNGED